MITRKEKEKFMWEAVKEARKVFPMDEVPIGAIIEYEGRIIARAYNQVEKLKDATAHAEILAITQASAYLSDWRLKDCSLFVTVEPCLMCAGAIKLSRLSHVYFGAYNLDGGDLLSSHSFLMSRTKAKLPFKVEGGILKEECASLLKDFFSRLRQ